jgi:arylsulfate sulfotransferase
MRRWIGNRSRLNWNGNAKMKYSSFPQTAILLILFSGFLTGCGAAGFNPPQLEGGPSNTANPLVAQYSIASACAGQAMVEFGPDTSYGRNTAWYPVPGSYKRTTVLVAGMRASTTYHMRSQLQCVGNTLTSADSTFTTGALLASPTFPSAQVRRSNPSLSPLENPGVELISGIATRPNEMQAFVMDRDANPIWYYDVGAENGSYPFNVKLLPNGHIILSIVTPTDSVLREADLAGTTIREMKVTALAQKMQAAAFNFVPNFFHHDILPLDNGHLIVLTNFLKNFTDLPGYPGTTQVVGDGIVDLDPNWNPVWAWNSFDYLDVNRHLFGLPDWTHSNALVYSPSDGNLLLSVRHQSWVLKIDYNNGAGTGNLLWRLGYQGDFALTQNSVPSDDPSGWFSFQHFPSLVSQSGPQTTLAIWDNGDYRPLVTGGICGFPPTPLCYSRATVFQVDESAKVANLLWDYTPGLFSIWGGSINQLPNGNVEFDANAVTTSNPNTVSEVQEVTQTSTPEIVWTMDLQAPVNAYRAYRIPSLYPGVTWQY